MIFYRWFVVILLATVLTVMYGTYTYLLLIKLIGISL